MRFVRFARRVIPSFFFRNFAIFAGLVDAGEGDDSANEAMAAFSFFLWIILTVLTAVLVYDRAHVLDEPGPATAAPKGELEPAAEAPGEPAAGMA